MTTILPQNTQNLDHKINQPQNTVCLEQKNYAIPENLTPTLLVMLETFRRSGRPRWVIRNVCSIKPPSVLVL